MSSSPKAETEAEFGTKAKEQMINSTGNPSICLGRMPEMSAGFLRAVRGQLWM